jgi:hypothetical protein
MILALRCWVLLAVAVLLIAPVSASAFTETPDQTAQAVGKVFATATDGNRIFVGGEFSQMSGPGNASKVSIGPLGAITMSTGGLVNSFSPRITLGGSAGSVRALALSPDHAILYIGGQFDHINGQAFSNFGAVNAITGDLIPGWSSPGAGSTVHALAVASNGKVFAGGAFQRAGGKSHKRVTAFFPGGAVDHSFNAQANDTVRSLALAGDQQTLFVGGIFTQINNVARQSVARVSVSTGALDAWAIPAGTITEPQNAWALVPRGGVLYGGFGKGPNFAAAFRLDNGNNGTQIWRRGFVGNVESLALDAGANRLYFGGHMGTNTLEQTVCGRPLSGLGYMDPATGAVQCGWIPQLEPSTNNGIGAWTLLLTNTQLWAGGRITSIGGINQQGIARFTL